MLDGKAIKVLLLDNRMEYLIMSLYVRLKALGNMCFDLTSRFLPFVVAYAVFNQTIFILPPLLFNISLLLMKPLLLFGCVQMGGRLYLEFRDRVRSLLYKDPITFVEFIDSMVMPKVYERNNQFNKTLYIISAVLVLSWFLATNYPTFSPLLGLASPFIALVLPVVLGFFHDSNAVAKYIHQKIDPGMKMARGVEMVTYISTVIILSFQYLTGITGNALVAVSMIYSLMNMIRLESFQWQQTQTVSDVFHNVRNFIWNDNLESYNSLKDFNSPAFKKSIASVLIGAFTPLINTKISSEFLNISSKFLKPAVSLLTPMAPKLLSDDFLKPTMNSTK